MTDTLILGNRTYSSWSLRAWLLNEIFELGAQRRQIDFAAGDVAEQLADVAPAATVPTLLTDDGAIISDSLAIAEEWASRAPGKALWPSDPKRRAIARAITAEMHSGFSALRGTCPMNLSQSYPGFPVSEAVRTDLARIETLWAYARDAAGEGPWLLGSYSIADAFYAPVAARIAGYDLAVGPQAQAYVQTHLAHTPFRRWRAMGLAADTELERYRQSHPSGPWPGPTPLRADVAVSGPSENDACPYSGDPVTDFLTIEGRSFGFCNLFCRDKTLHDPLAWPAFVTLWERKG